MRRAALLVGSALAALALGAAPASADGPRLVEAQGATFPQRSWVLTLPERRELQARDVEIREGGRVVDGLKVLPGRSAGERTFGVVLAIDVSESMHGKAIAGAMEAARAFAARREPGQQLGLLLFSREHRVALPLTTDQARIDAALAGIPRLSRGTRVYDAGMAGLEMLRQARVKAGSLVILSDGADVGSAGSSESFTSAARRAHVRVFGVGLATRSFTPGTLDQIAAQTGGVYSQAGGADRLKAIFGSLGEQLAREYFVTYRSLATLGSRVAVEARVAGFPVPATAVYEVAGMAAAVTPAPAREEGVPRAAMLMALLFVVLVAAAVLIILRGPRRTVPDRIDAYIHHDRPSLLDDMVAERERRETGLAGRLAPTFRWWPKFVEETELAGVRLAPVQLAIAAAGGTLTLVWLLAASGRVAAAVMTAFAPLCGRALIHARAERVRRTFVDQLPDNLQVVASAMRAGHSFESGVAVAADDAPEPMRSELRRVVSDERLGVPLDESMAAVAARMRCPEFEQVGMVLMAQRDAGGNAAELLDRTVDSLRDRAELRRLVTGLTAQGRFSGVIVTAMPFAVSLLLVLVVPDYFTPMLESPVGRLLLVSAMAMIGMAWVVIRKVVDIKV